MPYVITQSCVGNKDTSCYKVCPVDAIYPRPHDSDFDRHGQLYINPVECIDCGACEAACPHEAIYLEEDVPAHLASATKFNADFFLHAPR